MADTAVAITAGSGTNIDTRTEATNGNHRQVIVVGDPTTNAAVATVTDGAPAASDYALVVGLHPDSVNANGQATMANSAPVVLPSDFVGTSGFMKKEDVASADGDAGIPAMAVRKATPANTSGTDGDYEFLQASEGLLWVQQRPAFTASATFTPAASSHVAGDCNGAAAQFSFSPAPSSGSVVMITDAEFEIDGGTAEATAWRLHLYNVTPPSATADDGVWDLASGDRSAYLGYIDLGTAVDTGSTQWVETHGINKLVKLSGTTAFGYLVNLTTLTPAAVGHIVKLYGTPA